MSHVRNPAAAPNARQVRSLVHGTASRLSGRTRGPDPEVRRESYDVDDPRAKPWSKIGNGSVGEGLAHRDALVQAADELYQQQWREMPLAEIRDARHRREAAAAELQQLLDGGTAPIGRPAALRQTLDRLDEFLDRAAQRLRRIDLTVLRALLKRLDFATGRLFPSIDTIAADAGCARNSVIAALRRLKGHGFIAWVRRSMATGNAGEFAPQREQTSNAYFFDHRRGMAPRTWQRFIQVLTAKLGRLGAVPAGLRPPAPSGPRNAALLAVLDAVGAAIEARDASLPNASA